MAYLSPHYDHDLFISYPHGDFLREGVSPLKDWSEQFVKDLRIELLWNKDFKDKLTIFLDQDDSPGHGVDPTVFLPDQLGAGISRAALLMILVCEPYLDSEWCARELNLWLKSHGDPARTTGRIFPILVAPIADARWPRSLCDELGKPLPGFLFHDPSQKDPNLGRPFKWRGSATTSDRFNEELMKVVTRVTVQLNLMREEFDRQSRLEENAVKLEERGLVYLHARTPDTVHWDRAARDLHDHGYAVLPPRPEAEATDELDWKRKEKDRVETLIGCDALLLVGGDQEDIIGRDIAAVGRHSRHSARARSEKLLPCAIYDPVGGARRSDPTRRTAEALGIKWIDALGGNGDWVKVLQEWLRLCSQQLRRTA